MTNTEAHEVAIAAQKTSGWDAAIATVHCQSLSNSNTVYTVYALC